MSSEWPMVKLGSLADFQEGYVNPSQREPAYFDGPIKWLRATDLNDSVVADTTRTLSDKGFKSAGKSALLFEPGTLAISKSGTIGRLGILGDYMCGNRAVINIKPKQNAVPRYIFFVLRHLRPTIETLAEGSVQKNLYVSTLSNLDVPAPPKEVQQAFADMLGVLDDRITLLRETNATLEAIAQALFKSWFVDFDPVRAKMAGRAPEGMDEATAALFPDALVETELGLVPTGWKVGSILGIAKLLSGGTPKTDRPEYWGGDIPWASAKDVSQASDPVLLTTERTITELGLNGSSTKLVPAYATAVVARGATTGRLVMFGKEMAMNQTCYALVSHQNTPTVLSLQLRREMGRLVSAAHGSVFDTITTTTFEKSVCLLPPEALCMQLEKITRPIFDTIIANVAKAQLLSQLRDVLLPRLISGQLRLPEAKALAAEFTAH